jgi:MFS family permease
MAVTSSDWYGRKRVLLAGIGLSAASALVFLLWRDLPGLYVARLLTGLSLGAVAGTATAYRPAPITPTRKLPVGSPSVSRRSVSSR